MQTPGFYVQPQSMDDPYRSTIRPVLMNISHNFDLALDYCFGESCCSMKNYRKGIPALLFVLFCTAQIAPAVKAQAPEIVSSGDILSSIQKLGVLGSVLYVAAHPDDENTRLISYYANDVKAHTTYLSLTRGDGGQNLIGSEMRELLGIIRTNELLMARQLDGGNQMFSRANDFGYSKTPEETLEFWSKDEVLSDVVWAIRKHRPDVIVTRFPHEHLNGNHGHHTASAMLAFEAFDIANDPDVYPEQLEFVDPWQPQRLFFNTHWWFFGSREKFDEEDKTGWAQVDVGVFYPLIGLSNPEIAALSRSQHKSQGFGAAGSRETLIESLQLTKGDAPPDSTDALAGIDVTWNRLGDNEGIVQLISMIEQNFNPEAPYKSIDDLAKLHRLVSRLSPSFWRDRKLAEIEQIIIDCTGIYLAVEADGPHATPGDSVNVRVEMTNRSPVTVMVHSAAFMNQELLSADTDCPQNTAIRVDQGVLLPASTAYTTPYWLLEPGTEGMYRVDEQELRGLPELPSEAGIWFEVEIAGLIMNTFRPVEYRYTDPVEGEVFDPFSIVPPAFVNIDNGVYLFSDNESRQVAVRVRSSKAGVTGRVTMEIPEGWTAEPDSYPVNLDQDGEEKVYSFNVTPPAESAVAELHASLTTMDGEFDLSLTEIDYDHIPLQTVLAPATARIVRIDLEKGDERIGYIMGAGDDIPASLEEIGYDVDVLDEDAITADLLTQYQTIILGIRLYNTSEQIKYYQDGLFDFVRSGGTLIVQYNTTRGLKVDQTAPYDLALSRLRVTDEHSPVSFINADQAVLNYPNKLTTADFENWVQERGLYFPSEWGEEFTPVLRMNDPGEDPVDGALLVAKYGEGHFVYSGISMFRQLPVGVPGAFRLFVNMISLGSPSKS